jgi:hypothetical protein
MVVRAGLLSVSRARPGSEKKRCKEEIDAYLEEFGGTSIDADTFTLVQISFVVLVSDTLGMA